MMLDSPMAPEKYRARPYLFNVGPEATHQRAEMMNQLLTVADKVTVPQAIDIAFNPQVYQAERWQARVKSAWSRAPESSRTGDAAEVCRQIVAWNRRCDAESTGALAFYAFKQGLGNEHGAKVEPADGLKDQAILEALHKAPAGCGPNSDRSRSRTAATSASVARAANGPGRSAAAR